MDAAVAAQYGGDERIVQRRGEAVELVAVADGGDGLAEVAVAERIASAVPLAAGAVDAASGGEVGEEARDRLGGDG